MHSLEEAAAFAEAFVTTPFSHDPRHQRRIDMLTEYQRTGVAPPLPPAVSDPGVAGTA
jgi:ribose 5-phosphate isomerase B